MAIDSRDKRMSMITLASPVPAVLPDPDGTLGIPDRAMLIWLYHGFTYIAVPSFAEDDAAVLFAFEENRVFQRFEGNRVIAEED